MSQQETKEPNRIAGLIGDRGPTHDPHEIKLERQHVDLSHKASVHSADVRHRSGDCDEQRSPRQVGEERSGSAENGSDDEMRSVRLTVIEEVRREEWDVDLHHAAAVVRCIGPRPQPTNITATAIVRSLWSTVTHMLPDKRIEQCDRRVDARAQPPQIRRHKDKPLLSQQGTEDRKQPGHPDACQQLLEIL